MNRNHYVKFIDDLIEIKNDDKKLREKLENTIYVEEKSIKNGDISNIEAFVIENNEYFSSIFDCKKQILKNINTEDEDEDRYYQMHKYEFETSFFKINDIEKAINDVKTYSNDFNSLFTKIFEDNFMKNVIKTIDNIDVENEKVIEKIFETIKENMNVLRIKGVNSRFEFNQNENKFVFSTQQAYKTGNVEIDIEAKNINELLDKTLKYMTYRECFNDENKIKEYLKYDENLDGLDFEEAIEKILNDDEIILREIKYLNIDEKLDNMSFIQNEYGFQTYFELKKGNEIISEKYGAENVDFEKITNLLLDKDVANEYFKNHKSEPKEKKIKDEIAFKDDTKLVKSITEQEIKFKGNNKDYTCTIETYDFGKYGNLESVDIFDNKKKLVHFLCGNTINEFVEDSWYVHDKSDEGKIAGKILFEKGYLENTSIDKETFDKIKIEIIEDKTKNIGFEKVDDIGFIYNYLKSTIRKDYQENFLEKFDINKDLKETTESILQIYMKNENIKDYVEFEDRISEITSVVRKSTDIIMEKILDENSDKALKTIICNNIKQLGLTSDNNNYFERSDRTYYAPVEFDINTDNGLSEAKQLLKSKSEEIVDIHLNKIYKEICNDEELEKFIKKEVSHIGEKYFNFQNDVYALCREEKEEEIKFGRNREINFYKDKESFKRQIEFIIGFNLEDKRIESLQNYYNEKHNIKDMEQHKNELMSYNQKEVVNEKETNKHILVEEKDFGYCGDF